MRERGVQVLLIDKPVGISSFDIIRRLRRVFGATDRRHPKWKMGHAGTLDPLASGLMIIGVAEGTKELSRYLKLPKTYEAQVLLGRATDTGDLEGKTTLKSDVTRIFQHSQEYWNKIERVVGGMIGTLELPVPKYSAIKQGGKPLYKRARAGKAVAPPVKTMCVNDAQLLRVEHRGDELMATVRFDVDSGTYIRSLAEELGRRLNVPATLGGLRRTRIGAYAIEDAKTLDEFEQ